MQNIAKSLVLYLIIALSLCKGTASIKRHLVQQHQHHNHRSQRHQQSQQQQQQQPLANYQPYCNLGNYTYQLGERWNPKLPPFGVQVCVECECIVRQRKECFETKVTCRRIANECPIIDACPDGKKPVTTAGQCCKSCQSDNGTSLLLQAAQNSTSTTTISPPSLVDGGGGSSGEGNSNSSNNNNTYNNASITEQLSPLKQETAAALLAAERALYKNERIKEFQALTKTLNPCQKRNRSNNDKHPNGGGVGGSNSKGPKGNKNDINGIDSRLAFKSLHDSQGIQIQTNHHKNRQSDFSGVDDSLKHDHQHDVQAASISASNQQTNGTHQARTNSTRPTVAGPNMCTLGNETFQVGDRWNPNLPSFGVQVCVQCECVMRQRRSCNEAKVTCRRIANDCPIIDVCPDGRKPVTTEGQCCKSCQVGQ